MSLFLFHPLTEGSWSQLELQSLTDFFKKEVSVLSLNPLTTCLLCHLPLTPPPQVACPPYTIPSVTSFLRLLQLPLNTMRSCVQLMMYHLVSHRAWLSAHHGTHHTSPLPPLPLPLPPFFFPSLSPPLPPVPRTPPLACHGSSRSA